MTVESLVVVVAGVFAIVAGLVGPLVSSGRVGRRIGQFEASIQGQHVALAQLMNMRLDAVVSAIDELKEHRGSADERLRVLGELVAVQKQRMDTMEQTVRDLTVRMSVRHRHVQGEGGGAG